MLAAAEGLPALIDRREKFRAMSQNKFVERMAGKRVQRRTIHHDLEFEILRLAGGQIAEIKNGSTHTEPRRSERPVELILHGKNHGRLAANRNFDGRVVHRLNPIIDVKLARPDRNKNFGAEIISMLNDARLAVFVAVAVI